MKTWTLLLCTIISTGLSAQVQYGVASYYSEAFEGRPTASGEIYTGTKLTAAHASLDFGTMIRVTRLDNNASVELKVNDRGAFGENRVVDVSMAAAQKLDMLNLGVANVRVEVIGEGQISPPTAAKQNTKPKTSDESAVKSKQQVAAKASKASPSVKKNTSPVPKKKAIPSKVVKYNEKPMDFDLYKIRVATPEKNGYGVQVALFKNYIGVLKYSAGLEDDFYKNILVGVESDVNGTVYKVILGPFEKYDVAVAYKEALDKKDRKGFVVDLSTMMPATAE